MTWERTSRFVSEYDTNVDLYFVLIYSDGSRLSVKVSRRPFFVPHHEILKHANFALQSCHNYKCPWIFLRMAAYCTMYLFEKESNLIQLSQCIQYAPIGIVEPTIHFVHCRNISLM